MMEKQTKIGTVPSGWIKKKLKDVFYINEFSLPSNTPADYQFKYITIEQVSTNQIDYGNCETFRFSDAPGRARRIVRDNDILISGVRPNLKSFAIFNNPDAGSWICSTGFFVLTAKNEDDNLISYYELLSEIGERQFYSYVAGSNYPAIGDSDIRNIRLVLPSSVKEKTAIANILSKVDEAIAAVQGSIAAAERLKESLMQNLLTGRMKPDGTLRKEDEFYMDEKFGKVPIGWEVKRIDEIAERKTDVIDPTKTKEVYDYIGLEHIIPDEFTRCGKGLSNETVALKVKFEKGDLLYGKLRPYLNKVFISDISGVGSTEFIVLKQNKFTNWVYLNFQLQRFLDYTKSMTAGTQHPRASWKDIKHYLVCVPKDEQEKESIENKLLSLEQYKTSQSAKIEMLERLKKSLMQNLLTGKVKANNHK